MKTALVLFADGSEELEAISIVNILRRGGVAVTLAGLSDGALHGSRGVVIQPDCVLETVLQQDFDLVVLPGGQPGTTHLKNDVRVLNLVRRQHQAGRWVAAICAAPSVLAEAGLLHGKHATCYPTCLDAYPDVHLSTEAVVQDGQIITSRGPGTALDFALTLLEKLTPQRASVENALVR